MLQNQFFMRLILLMAVGIVYVKAYMNMAKRNSKETGPERHRFLRILGVFWAFMAVVMGGLGVYMITQIDFPYEAIGPYISPNMIVRTSDKTMYWGYATFPQSQCFSMISGVFEFLALSAYCFMFKSSHSKWYSKVGKIGFCILFYMFYASATNFHYFDLYEWTAPILFTIMAYFALRNKEQNHSKAETGTNSEFQTESITPIVEETPENTPKVEAESKYMPCLKTEKEVFKSSEEENHESQDTLLLEVNITDEHSDVEVQYESSPSNKIEEQDVPSAVNEINIETPRVNEDNAREQASSEHVIRFCRHCGGKLDYQCDRYCKRCGKQLF
jgi:hypothetical protein